MTREIPSVSDLSREARLVLALTAAFVIFRAILATQSSFPFHQGWNEGHYALVAAGFDSHLLIPRYGTNHVYNVPPLFPYAVWVSFNLLGTSELAARLPTILAAAAMLLATYALGVQVFADRRTALTGTVILVTLPYFQLYGGRAQTDVLMTALFTAALVLIIKGYDTTQQRNAWLVAGGGFFVAAVATKQTSLLLALVILTFLVLRRRFDRPMIVRTVVLVVASAVALLPLLAWFYVNFRLAPAAFVSDWEQELLGRTPPFANLSLIFAIAGVIGFTPAVLLLAGVGGTTPKWPLNPGREIPFACPSILLVWVVVVGAFVIYRTPHGHQYYAVALLPPIALLAAQGINSSWPYIERIGIPAARPLLIGIVLASTISGSVVLFELSGEFSAAEGGGERIASETGAFLSSTASDEARVLVASGFRPQIQWYTRQSIDPGHVHAFTVGELTQARVQHVASHTTGPVYVVAPAPSWASLPMEKLERVHSTRPYEPTLVSLLNRPPIKGTKFGFYVTERYLVVYRVLEENRQLKTGDETNRRIR